MLYYGYQKSLKQQRCADRINSNFADEAPSIISAVTPRTAITLENMDVLKQMTTLYHLTVYDESEASLKIPRTHLILYDNLKLKRVCVCWFLHKLTEAQNDTGITWSKENLKRFRTRL